MKKRLLLVCVIVLAILCFLPSCAGAGDWSYHLSNGYRIGRLSADQVYLMNDEVSGTIIIETNIDEFCYNQEFVCLKMYYGFYGETDDDNAAYYIVNMLTHEKYGSFSKEEYDSHCIDLDIGEKSEWLDVHRGCPTTRKTGDGSVVSKN